jgi:hypothetical protein
MHGIFFLGNRKSRSAWLNAEQDNNVRICMLSCRYSVHLKRLVGNSKAISPKHMLFSK